MAHHEQKEHLMLGWYIGAAIYLITVVAFFVQANRNAIKQEKLSEARWEQWQADLNRFYGTKEE